MASLLAFKASEKPFLYGAIGVGVGLAGAALIKKGLSRNWKRVGRVDQLWVHPLKGGKGKSVTSAEFQELGLRAAMFKDRTFGIVKDNKEYASVKEYPQIALIGLTFHEGEMRLQAPGKTDLIIPEADLEHSVEKEITIRMLDVDIKTMLISKDCDQFISEFLLGQPSGLHLVYHYSPSAQRPVRPTYHRLWPDSMLEGDVPALNYGTSYTLLTWPSMHALNKALDQPIGPEWFRSNVLVATDSDEPFQEDQWTGRVRLGKDVVLRFNKPCHRCAAITVDPETGIKDPNLEPLKTLRKFRLLDPSGSEINAARRKAIGESPLFAVNYSLDQRGFVDVGDEVFVEVI